jgi:predicted transcriptional regulator
MVTDANGRLEVVTVRFTKRVRDLIKQVADARGSDESAVIRQAVHEQLARLSFLTDDEKKALGQASPSR